MGLNLFNFDVIRDAKDANRYLIIDINYFPGYAKMPSYEPVLTEFFWDMVTKKNHVWEIICWGVSRNIVGEDLYHCNVLQLPLQFWPMVTSCFANFHLDSWTCAFYIFLVVSLLFTSEFCKAMFKCITVATLEKHWISKFLAMWSVLNCW